MNRRLLLALGLAALLPAALPAAASSETIAYAPGVLEKHLAAGETVFLDFTASWCTTCAAQSRVIDALRAENSAYDDALTFIDVDWDTYKDSELVADLNIPRRSTLVVLRGNSELGRVVAQTSTEAIKTLMETGVAGSAF